MATVADGMKIARKYLGHYINVAAPSATSAEYEKFGKGVSEFTKEMNYSTEETEDITGETEVVIHGAKPTSEADPVYARKGTKLFDRLQTIIDDRLEGDELKTDVIDVHLWEEVSETPGTYKAVKESAWIEVTSYGGDTVGYTTPFTLHYANDPVKGTFNLETKTFTAE